MKKKVSFKEWELAIREARQYINRYDKVRWRVCKIALRVCDIYHGGRKTQEHFTVTKFATAIDLNPKTLNEWIRIKIMVYDKITQAELKQNPHSYDDLRQVAMSVTRQTSKKEVLDKWRTQLAIPQDNKKFIKYERHLNAVLYNATKPMRMMNVDTQYLEKIISKCELIAKFLKKELELRKTMSQEKRMKKRHRKISEAIQEANEMKYEEVR